MTQFESEISICHLLARSAIGRLAIVQCGTVVCTITEADVEPGMDVLYMTVPALAWRTNSINSTHRAALRSPFKA